MRCLVVAPAISPVVGGAETIAHVLSKGLITHGGLDVSLVVGNEPEPELVSLVTRRGNVHVVDGSGTMDGNVPWEAATFSRSEVIHDILDDFDVVHAMSHDAVVSAVVAMSGKRRTTRLVATLSEMSPQTSEFGRARSRFVYTLPVDGFVHLSNYYRSVARQLGAPEVPDIVAAGIDEAFATADAAAGRALVGAAPDDVVVVCPSRFTPRKGQLDLLNALEEIPADTRSRLLVVLVGSTNSAYRGFEREVRRWADASSCRVLVREVPRPVMPNLITGADLVVLPSHSEGLGFAAIEAMLARTPVVLTSVSGFEEVITSDDQAIVVDPGDPFSMAAAITSVVQDASLRDRLIHAGSSRAIGGFGLKTFIGRVASLYDEITRA